jgi:acetyl-CoA acetyltransferase
MAKLNEVVVIDAVRSAIGKSGSKGMEKNGQLCQASAQDLLANTMRGLLDRVHTKSSKFDEHDIEMNLNGMVKRKLLIRMKHCGKKQQMILMDAWKISLN